MTVAGFSGRRVVVAGAGVAGAACASAVLRRGGIVTVVDRTDTARTAALAAAGATVVITGEPRVDLLDGADDLIVSPGIPPHHPLVMEALARGIDVYSEPELAWRLRGPDAPPWLAVTGTNGKTTTVTMLASILRAAGLRTAALGNIGEPLVDLPDDYDVLAVELSSFQLHWSSTLAPQVGALLNLADDHLEWHGDIDAYGGAKTAVWRGAVAIGNIDDLWVREKLAAAPGARVGFSLGENGPTTFGVVDGRLVTPDGRQIIEASAIRPAGAHNVANALAAAALALAWEVPIEAVRAGLENYVPEHHRNEFVATVGGVSYVDDSKATNPHAALASLTAYRRVVWVVGGQLKGVDISDLVISVADRLAGVVLLGVDRAEVAAALARHAPWVPVVDVARTDDEAMGEVVKAASELAATGDTVLLAPAAASKDMFESYAHRGRAFAAAVAELPGEA